MLTLHVLLSLKLYLDPISSACISANLTISDSPASRLVTKRPLLVQHRIKYLQNERETSGSGCEKAAWLHHWYYWVRAQARGKITSTLLNHQRLGHQRRVCVLLWTTGGRSPSSVVLGGSVGRAVVSAHEMPPEELTLQSLPIPACPVWLLVTLVKATCSFESIQALSAPHHDSAQRLLKNM